MKMACYLLDHIATCFADGPLRIHLFGVDHALGPHSQDRFEGGALLRAREHLLTRAKQLWPSGHFLVLCEALVIEPKMRSPLEIAQCARSGTQDTSKKS
jgi:hypothetical protein